MSLTDSMIWRSGLKNCLPRRSGSPFAGGAEQDEPGCGEGGFEVVPVVVHVGDDDLPGPPGGQRGFVEDGQQSLTLVGWGAGERETDGQAGKRAQQVQLLNIPWVPWPFGWCLRSG
jgi:hypothetical protein